MVIVLKPEAIGASSSKRMMVDNTMKYHFDICEEQYIKKVRNTNVSKKQLWNAENAPKIGEWYTASCSCVSAYISAPAVLSLIKRVKPSCILVKLCGNTMMLTNIYINKKYLIDPSDGIIHVCGFVVSYFIMGVIDTIINRNKEVKNFELKPKVLVAKDIVNEIEPLLKS